MYTLRNRSANVKCTPLTLVKLTWQYCMSPCLTQSFGRIFIWGLPHRLRVPVLTMSIMHQAAYTSSFSVLLESSLLTDYSVFVRKQADERVCLCSIHTTTQLLASTTTWPTACDDSYLKLLFWINKNLCNNSGTVHFLLFLIPPTNTHKCLLQ